MNKLEREELYRVTGLKTFSRDYRDSVFLTWFQAGKPEAPGLFEIIAPVVGTNIKPTTQFLRQWISEEFLAKATKLDQQMNKAMTEQVVSERVAMLKRHSELGRTMQKTAIEYLEANQADLNANAAVRLLVEGVRIERESAGIPEAIDRMTHMSDTQLLEELGKIIKDAPTKIEQIEENYD